MLDEKLIPELRILELNCPVRMIDSEIVGDLLLKLIRLKCKGYNTSESKYFAFDKYDFIGRHLMAGYFESSGCFVPLIAFKGISKESCDYWKLPFLGDTILNGADSYEHVLANKEFIEEGNIGYASTLAISGLVKSKLLKIELLKIFEVMIANFNLDFEIDRSCCIARVSQRAPSLISRVGYRPICLNGNELPPIKIPQCINDEFLLMTFKELSAEGNELTSQYDQLWKGRIVIDEFTKNTHHNYRSYPLYARTKAS